MKRAQTSVSHTVSESRDELTGLNGSCTAQRPEADEGLQRAKRGAVPGSRFEKLKEVLDEA